MRNVSLRKPRACPEFKQQNEEKSLKSVEREINQQIKGKLTAPGNPTNHKKNKHSSAPLRSLIVSVE
eukprot:2536569-Pleurochrysis_carterae.AAC.1